MFIKYLLCARYIARDSGDNKDKLASQLARIFFSGGEVTGIQTGWERRMLEISSIKEE